MKYSYFLFAATVSAAAVHPKPRPHRPIPDADGKYTLEAPGIKAQVITFLHCP
jgi:aldose 1-epimerase